MDSIYLLIIYGNSWIYNHVRKKLFTDVECKHCFNVHWQNPKYTAVILALLNKASAWNHTRFYNKIQYPSLVSTFATAGYSLFLEFLKQNKHFFVSQEITPSMLYFTLSLFPQCMWNVYIIVSYSEPVGDIVCEGVFFPLHKNCLQVLCAAKAMKSHVWLVFPFYFYFLAEFL